MSTLTCQQVPKLKLEELTFAKGVCRLISLVGTVKACGYIYPLISSSFKQLYVDESSSLFTITAIFIFQNI